MRGIFAEALAIWVAKDEENPPIKVEKNLVNLFHPLPDASAAEVFENLLSHGPLRIERIVSQGQSSPRDTWFAQDEDQWILVLQGEVGIAIEFGSMRVLRPGNHLFISAQLRRRIVRTSANEPTVWLSVWLKPPEKSTVVGEPIGAP